MDYVKAHNFSWQILIQGEWSKRNQMTDNASKIDKEVDERFTLLWREIRTLRVRSDLY